LLESAKGVMGGLMTFASVLPENIAAMAIGLEDYTADLGNPPLLP